MTSRESRNTSPQDDRAALNPKRRVFTGFQQKAEKGATIDRINPAWDFSAAEARYPCQTIDAFIVPEARRTGTGTGTSIDDLPMGSGPFPG